ncbi:metallophosphoesterase [Marivita sp. GX14005]|uniref:metallophosphoesterase family protein n=1 Tax=Marivita sp. GX14005 TaxID=2942276 RepID=UPI002018B280|nr:metallophosphoesterase [Marivita sp. GX14005]MCL3883228.1 metallophosphoesterase [Marivita sp. GX14005]
MRRLVHLSDLHFGRARPELLAPLVSRVNALAPDLVAISGDLTQRARRSQFAEARDFLARIEAPQLAVPGNHDVPLENLAARLLWPFRQYKRAIGRDLNPQFADDEIVVQGVNTVNPLAHQSGKFGAAALARVKLAFAGADDERTRIVVAHHPLEHGPNDSKKPMRGAERAMTELALLETDAILSGHLHSWRAEPFAEKAGRLAVLQVHAGTGLSTRQRGEPNDFNLLEIERGTIRVTRYAATEDGTDFTAIDARTFRADASGWSEHAE